jgi:transcriptional regulator with XRE-family HTH domain
MIVTKNNLKEIIRAKRKHLNLLQKDVSEKLGHDTSYLTNIEIGRRNIQFDKLFDLLDLLGITLHTEDTVHTLLEKVNTLEFIINQQAKEILDFKRTIREKTY